MINRVREIHDFIISGGRAASIPMPAPLPETRITEMVNGVLVTRPLKKVTDLNKTKTTTLVNESEPEITILNDSWERQHNHGGEGKAASSIVPGDLNINKVKMIHDFIASNGKIY